jgi:hypothetical protein
MSPVISSNVSEEVKEQVEKHREGEGDEKESRSAAVNRLVRAGLDAEESPDGVVLTYPALVSMVGWIFVAGAFMDVSTTVGYAGLAVVAFGLLHTVASRYIHTDGF